MEVPVLEEEFVRAWDFVQRVRTRVRPVGKLWFGHIIEISQIYAVPINLESGTQVRPGRDYQSAI
jgi:hypothetical protein